MHTLTPGHAAPRGSKKTDADKAALRSAGFIQAQGRGWCCVCGKRIARRQWIRKMPKAYVGVKKTQHHMAHRKCVMQVVAGLSMKSGQQVSV